MRILLDACIPERLRHDLVAAGTVETARFAALSHLSNGALITAMVDRFDVLITIDTNLQYQQNLTDRPIAVVILRS
jgi:predicted nuclease of predicted toxin-antitoxin system